MNENQLMISNDQKRHRSITKSFEDNTKIPTSTTNRIKRKTLLTTDSEDIIYPITKKLDIVKSIEFETKDQYGNANIDPYSQTDESLLKLNDNFDRENDFDDYADRIFDYLGEACKTQETPSLPQVEINQIISSEKEIKPFLCTFCPYFTRNLQEFQIHIAKHTEKNFRCLLCNCMYKYRRDCVTHMKRKHSNTVTGSISQYIQKMNDTTNIPPSSSSNQNLFIEPKQYGCPYCSLMTKSTSSIYKHQSRKHASFPKIVHKYSTDDPNNRHLVAILKQKSIKSKNSFLSIDEQIPMDSNINEESSSLVNRNRCAASKHIIAHNIHSSKIFQCCLCGYRARHRSNVVRHVKKLHSIDQNELTTSQSDENSKNLIINHDEEQIPNYSFNTTVQAPLIVNTDNNQPNKPYADIHLSINIFLPKKNSFDQITSDYEDKTNDIYSDEDISDDDDDMSSSSHQQNISSGSLYKPHKCRRCFYRSNWKTDMLHHIRLKHHINHPTKSDYISMNYDLALNSFSDYEKTFGKVLKNRLLLPKIDYIDCTWDELKSKLFLSNDQKKLNRQCLSSSSIEQTTIINNKTFSSMNNEEQ